MMNYRSLRFMRPICRVLRANYQFDLTNFRDPILTEYGIVSDRVNCFLVALGSDVVNNPMVGMIAVDTFTAHFPGNAPVRVNDVLLIEDEYYDVRSVTNHGNNGWEMEAVVTKKNLQRS